MRTSIWYDGEDRLREHPLYARVALDAVNLYLGMYDRPLGANGAAGANGDGTGNDGAAERKKAAKKAKKEAQKAEREAAEKAAKQDPNKAGTKTKEEDPKKKDDDPHGLKLVATTDPLGEAAKFLVPVLQFAPKNIDGQIAGFELYIRRSKFYSSTPR